MGDWTDLCFQIKNILTVSSIKICTIPRKKMIAFSQCQNCTTIVLHRPTQQPLLPPENSLSLLSLSLSIHLSFPSSVPSSPPTPYTIKLPSTNVKGHCKNGSRRVTLFSFLQILSKTKSLLCLRKIRAQ